MKNYLILILCLLSLGLHAQQITVGNVAQIKPSQRLQALNTRQLRTNPQGLLNIRDVRYLPENSTLYEKDGVYIGLWDYFRGDAAKRTLAQAKEELLWAYSLVNTIVVNSAEIKEYNNINYLIVNKVDHGENYYRFYSEMHNDQAINGFIKYKKEDKDKATAILTDLLNHAQFKK